MLDRDFIQGNKIEGFDGTHFVLQKGKEVRSYTPVEYLSLILEYFYSEADDCQFFEDKMMCFINAEDTLKRYIRNNNLNKNEFIELFEDLADQKEKIEKYHQYGNIKSANGKITPSLKLRNKKKTDLIRVISALYDLKFFENPEGQIPTKEEVMTLFGNFLGEDFSKYHAYFGQAKNQSPEANIAIFEQMKNIILNQVI